ncbi:primosomal protein N' [Arthrobacter sp. CAU 1506]|uniref:primosomal protein N' n=1 Tax=Arthrobacter sp. CAU 1506 TaxID=2560052 RepID=UPI0010AD4F2E|nr:primosomal protein N' [Arthrobacter sp. CAU 1506]TJY70374.1 primosomal protein N' [Arthrobacter sp. CAU 1506]
MGSDPHQLSLLQGFGAPKKAPGTSPAAATNPVARVLIETSLPHLDRIFDYLVPETLDAEAVPGARVKARFGGQEMSGFITRRTSEAPEGVKLAPLAKVVSAQPVLSDELLQLATAVAERYAGNVSDVLRAAIPARVAKVEKEFATREPEAALGTAPAGAPEAKADKEFAAREPDAALAGAPAEPSEADGAPTVASPDPYASEWETAGPHPQPADGTGSPEPSPGAADAYAGYEGAGNFLAQLAAGAAPRAVLASHKSYGPASWSAQVAHAVASVRQSGRGAVVVVPDAKDLASLEAELQQVLGADQYVRLTAEDGPTPRYRNYLRLLHGEVSVAVGTRSAAYAPVQDLGLVALWDDGDDLLIEQRAPYQHAREVLLLRTAQIGCAALFAGVSRSGEAQRLVESGWASALTSSRPFLRKAAPRILNTADSFQQERDPMLRQARLPHAAWLAAKEGLERGPVLVQVARTGFSPALSCQDCRTPARCTDCNGPLAQSGRSAVPACRWCGRLATHCSCPECGSQRLRASAIGALRTAEELGRAFPGATVVSSSGDHIKSVVESKKALVVATPGAEPVAPGGYAAALLLDGNSMLSRESLRTPEDVLRRWFRAASLVQPSSEGGLVVVTADQDTVVAPLVRWDPAGAAAREMQLRRELQLPPAVRIAALTGKASGIEAFMADFELAGSLRTVGPVELPSREGQAREGQLREHQLRELQARPGEGGEHRLLLFFSYQDGPTVTAALRHRKAALAAKRVPDPVQVRCDGVDLL